MAPHLGWRGVFIAFGGLGLVWAAWWFRWYRDDPANHPSVSAQELKLIEAGRAPEASHSGKSLLRLLPSNRSVVALCVAYFANGYGFYFLITWLPTYLEQQRGFSKAGLSLFAGLPLLLSVFADLFGGIATDRLTRRFGLRIGRAGVGSFAYLISAAAILTSAFTANAVMAATLIAVAAAASMFTLAASWAACIDIGGRHSGVVSAAMNTAGQIGGILSPILLAYLVAWFADWRLPLIAMCVFYSFGLRSAAEQPSRSRSSLCATNSACSNAR
jgi:nitrate/nitrite transporter NarK